MHPSITKRSLRVILVDDEKEACDNLTNIIETYCNEDQSVDISGIAHNTTEAGHLIQQLKPDAIFLDIEMPGENGFEFLERIAPFNFELIFVTAYDEFAIKAIRLNALDYILKPISIPELQQAIVKLKQKIDFTRLLNNKGFFKEFSDTLHQKKRMVCLRLRTPGGLETINFNDILFIEAKGAYSKFFFMAGGQIKEVIMSYSIAEYEQALPNDIFYRIHKSFLVNCSKIESLTADTNPSVSILQFHLPVSRRRQNGLTDFMRKNNPLKNNS